MSSDVRKKAVLVMDSGRHPEHRKRAVLLEKIIAERYECVVVDMAEPGALHEKYFKIRNAMPCFMVTLDLAGFEMQTENDTYSYNIIPCRMAHLLFGSLEEYEDILAGTFNFSMFFYAEDELCRKIREQYSEVPNVRCYPVETKACMTERDVERVVRNFWKEGKIE